ncbi:hypothetical protein BDV26DRAFT_58731 [Aspergillus bertholletiae]|uniref:Uncharacterized protein n=1 Tax=Aspergillus bertholletiae TaxID=1226010 RepID=A0A5N7AVA7_9EURO|nr:hypothetical protein BDV26DRAFT_58731 [Aspergillus bertholletiae]
MDTCRQYLVHGAGTTLACRAELSWSTVQYRIGLKRWSDDLLVDFSILSRPREGVDPRVERGLF